MPDYDIQIVAPRDRQAADAERETLPKRKLDWDRAMREAAEAELSIQSHD
ncbi:hypothetical protein ACXR8U_06915 [Methylobacterium radiotolerans]|uniref:Uncharacterized protein n=1 Tax=marine sediment metagenome TaxID=412755 RepID=X1GG55_9ZZZZ|nr:MULTISPECIES: hypothetical protein [Methylobacterium]GAN51950.1 hypothetical protein ME121_6051 [Methylobacterium sp. ME121]KZC02399.1 hypothetical protein AU375_01196 [Methylobacterium radiotolerans]MBN6822361.1 hypothetical protein [Methylobacterium organophilum]MBY0252198.1 hypothetical protein [Methylobacterium organophilum]SFT26314.1 hypothetical protein SAMN04487845_13513 [Methylobacterium sp. yr668]